MINAEKLLDWYDSNARPMPWRIPPDLIKAGVKPDPYKIWMSEIMLQQTTVAAVIRYFQAFQARWPDVHALANAKDEDVLGEWAGLGYYARARNLIKCARVVSAQRDGHFPQTEIELLSLPGIGPYTAAAVAAIAFDLPATVVDANVERVISRVYAIKEPLPDSKNILRKLAEQTTPTKRAGDYAQAMMDLGATICGQKPNCAACPILDNCDGQRVGIAANLPNKRPKPPKPIRYGVAYMVQRQDGTILLETRPEKGLLGGMLALPTTDWLETTPTEAPPLAANWIKVSEPVKHTFTHFHLLLSVKVASVELDATPSRGRFTKISAKTPDQLPTVMRKAFQVGAKAFLEINS